MWTAICVFFALVGISIGMKLITRGLTKVLNAGARLFDILFKKW